MVVTLSTEDNAKLLQQPKSEFKQLIIWNSFKSKVTTQTRNQYQDCLIDASFQRVDRL